MKKSLKILSAVLAVALVAALSIGGTLAYLTSQDEVKNTFTVGKVQIKLDEAPVDENGKTKDGPRVEHNDYTMIPGVTLDKDPTITVLGGSEDCYVRALITFRNADALIDLYENPPAGAPGDLRLQDMFLGSLGEHWTLTSISDAEDGTRIFEVRYDNIVEASAEDTVLPPVFRTIEVPGFLTAEDMAAIGRLNIDVFGQAIQTETFTSVDQAWQSF